MKVWGQMKLNTSKYFIGRLFSEVEVYLVNEISLQEMHFISF